MAGDHPPGRPDDGSGPAAPPGAADRLRRLARRVEQWLRSTMRPALVARVSRVRDALRPQQDQGGLAGIFAPGAPLRPVGQLGRTVALWARLGTAARTTQGQLLLGVAAGILLLAALVLVVGRLTPPPAPAERPAAPPAAQVPPAEPTAPLEPAGAPPATPGPTTVALFREALPLLLGIFWLLASWLVDAEAKRVFVVREPWGQRRTLGYSCLAVGCVFPLIVAALIFSAWGSVRLILWLYNNQSPSAALRAAFLLAGLLAAFLALRAALTRWLAERSGQS